MYKVYYQFEGPQINQPVIPPPTDGQANLGTSTHMQVSTKREPHLNFYLHMDIHLICIVSPENQTCMKSQSEKLLVCQQEQV